MRDCCDSELHRQWWAISIKDTVIAVCNILTNELITREGSKYNLKTEYEEAKQKVGLFIHFYSTVDEAKALIRNNTEWKDRYATYASEISNNVELINSARRSFREWSPLKFYINVTNSKRSNEEIRIELRYLGQTVAKLIHNGKNNELLLTTKDYDKINERDFQCFIQLMDSDWTGQKAKDFRNFFKNRKQKRSIVNNKGNEEHRIESLLLTEFSKTKEKALPFIQPIKVGNIRFPMPTPISASNHKKLSYCGFRGGGIDIFTRVGRNGASAKLCIIEVKDENKAAEPPKEAVKQALAYAVFIRELLRRLNQFISRTS